MNTTTRTRWMSVTAAVAMIAVACDPEKEEIEPVPSAPAPVLTAENEDELLLSKIDTAPQLEHEQDDEYLGNALGNEWYDPEDHLCGDAFESVRLVYRKTADQIVFRGLHLGQYDKSYATIPDYDRQANGIRGIDYWVTVHSEDGKIVYDSQYQTQESWGFSFALYEHNLVFPLASKPYVRVLMGRNGDGLPSCLWSIYPNSPG